VLSRQIAEAYRQVLFWLGRKPAFSWLGRRVFAPVDTWLYPRMHGLVVSTGPAVLPLLLLTTIGRKSGRRRSVPVLYLTDGDRLVIVASNWGRPGHPAWSANLLAHPAADAEIGKRQLRVRACLVSGDEKMVLWPKLLALCPVWQTYADRSGRDLRIFSLRSSC
jgi:deazaflavin-dependent oxidoreductase (nitroreductase family)